MVDRVESVLPALLLALASLGAGCGREAHTPTEPAGPAASARTLPIPGSSLPAERPPLQGAATATLIWDAPEGWVAEEPASRMRLAQYRATGPAGDAECLVFYFGRGQGGDPMSNAERWAGQFLQPDGNSSSDEMQVTRLEGTQLPVILVEITGTYNGGMTMTSEPAREHPGWMLLGGIAEGPDAPWFFKFTGPQATVRAQREAFVHMLESIRTGS